MPYIVLFSYTSLLSCTRSLFIIHISLFILHFYTESISFLIKLPRFQINVRINQRFLRLRTKIYSSIIILILICQFLTGITVKQLSIIIIHHADINLMIYLQVFCFSPLATLISNSFKFSTIYFLEEIIWG